MPEESAWKRSVPGGQKEVTVASPARSHTTFILIACRREWVSYFTVEEIVCLYLEYEEKCSLRQDSREREH